MENFEEWKNDSLQLLWQSDDEISFMLALGSILAVAKENGLELKSNMF